MNTQSLFWGGGGRGDTQHTQKKPQSKKNPKQSHKTKTTTKQKKKTSDVLFQILMLGTP